MKCELVNNQQNKAIKKNLKDILYQAKQSIDVNKSEPPTSTLSTTFHNPKGEANPHFQFIYVPQHNF